MTSSIPTNRPKAVLFDHDGVLVASEPLHWTAWELLFNELGLPYHENEIRAMVGKTAPQILEETLNRYRPDWNQSSLIYDLEALAKRKNDYYLKEVIHRLQPYPGVREGLEWLKNQNIRIAVVSNAKQRELTTALSLLKLDQYFDQIVSRDDTGKCKPDPTPYLFAAASLGCEPTECIAVEDSPTGLEAALFAKIPVAAVETNFSFEQLKYPVPGRLDLTPTWIGKNMSEFFHWMKACF